MTVTDQLLDFIRNATPRAEDIAHARAELARFREAARRGNHQPVVAALRQALAMAGSPGSAEPHASTGAAGSAEPYASTRTTGSAEPSPWHAWLSGTAACASGRTDDTSAEWVAVCAAADAVGGPNDAVTAQAVAVGYRVAAGAAAALGTTHTEAGWCILCTAGTVGAAGSVGRLLRLDAPELRAMFGICATQAAGITEAAGTPTEAVQVGKAAGNAVEAGLLARNGFTSSTLPLEGRRGMFALMSTSPAADALLSYLVWPEAATSTAPLSSS